MRCSPGSLADATGSVLLFEFGEDFDFGGGVEGEGDGADGGAGVAAGFAEDGDEQVGSAVGDLGLLVEAGGGLDPDADADDAGDFAQVAVAGIFQDGEGVDDAEFRGFLALLDGLRGGDGAGDLDFAVFRRDL